MRIPLVWTAALALFVTAAGAAEEKFLPHYAKGTVVELGPYDPASDTYQVIAVETPAQGPFFAERRDLARAVPSLNTNRVRRNPDSVVSGRFRIEASVLLLAESEVELLGGRGDAKVRGKKASEAPK